MVEASGSAARDSASELCGLLPPGSPTSVSAMLIQEFGALIPPLLTAVRTKLRPVTTTASPTPTSSDGREMTKDMTAAWCRLRLPTAEAQAQAYPVTLVTLSLVSFTDFFQAVDMTFMIGYTDDTMEGGGVRMPRDAYLVDVRLSLEARPWCKGRRRWNRYFVDGPIGITCRVEVPSADSGDYLVREVPMRATLSDQDLWKELAMTSLIARPRATS